MNGFQAFLIKMIFTKGEQYTSYEFMLPSPSVTSPVYKKIIKELNDRLAAAKYNARNRTGLELYDWRITTEPINRFFSQNMRDGFILIVAFKCKSLMQDIYVNPTTFEFRIELD